MRYWAALLFLTFGPLMAAADEIAEARYGDPTTRYPHGVLGDDIEYGALEIVHASGQVDRFELPLELVFEDLEPRLADVTGDGAPEIIVVESSNRLGARLAVWNSAGRLAATPHIGSSNRWLAPVGIADLNGDGYIDIAFVDRPHLAKVLRVWSYRDGALTEIASIGGLSNHRIGEDFISGGIRICDGLPEMITADASWRDVVSTRFEDGELVSGTIGEFTGQESLTSALGC